MDYAASQERLLREFGRLGFMRAFRAGEFHKWEYQVEGLHNGSVVRVAFPGAKSRLDPPRYDYRVDMIKWDLCVTLSHANIIVDIYNKCRRRELLIPDLQTLLRNVILEGPVDPYRDTRLLLSYAPSSPPEASLLDDVERIHKAQGKPFNRMGNHWDLAMEELIALVKWVALQEDINYPMPKCEGRRMPFARYAEAVHCAAHGADIAPVIKRALAHQRPRRWRGVDYGVIDQVNPRNHIP
jgi:hypothetical protein